MGRGKFFSLEKWGPKQKGKFGNVDRKLVSEMRKGYPYYCKLFAAIGILAKWVR